MNESDFSFAPEEVKDAWAEIHGNIEAAVAGLKGDDWSHFTPEFLDTLSSVVNLGEIETLISQRQQIARGVKASQPEANVQIESHLPITAFFIGDIHHGSVFTNEQLWDQHRQEISETDGAYVIFLHNLVENAIPSQFPHGMLDATLPPDIQFQSMQQQIKELDEEGKVLGAIDADCHEGWSWKKAGISAAQLLFGYEDREFPVLENGGILHLWLGSEEYQIGLWHKQGPFNSNFNKEHSLRQLRRLGNRQTDVEAGAHFHTSVATNEVVGYKDQAQQVAFLRVGSYKGYWPGEENPLNDKFVVDRWGKTGEAPGQSVIFHPDHHQFEATLGFDASMEKHEAIRITEFLDLLGEKGSILNLIKGLV